MGIGEEKSLSAAGELRRRAEEQLKARFQKGDPPRTGDDTQRLLHELQVHQVELELQNAELRQARDVVEALLEKYTDLYDFTPVGYFTFDRYGTIQAANLSGADLLGVERSRLIGRRFGQFVTTANRPTFTAFLDSVFTRQRKESCEVALLNESNLSLIVQIEGLAAASGQEIFAAARDVTDRNRAEEKIKKLNEELESLVRDRTAELERMNSELETFCYAISHEIRAPIARLEGFGIAILEMAREVGEEQIMHCAERIVAASNRLRSVIGSLLTMNRISRSEMHLENVNLSDMAEQIVSELREKIGHRSIKFSIAPDVTATGDLDMLGICMRKLLVNAAKYSSKTPGAEVEFGQRIVDGKKVYFVKDNGVGFDMEFAKNIFQPFCRIHNEDEFEGTGVGLATVSRIIEKHNGRIWIEAKPGEGATFFFAL